MDADELTILIPIVSIIGGLGIAALGIYKSMRLRELAYRERIAMIERGLVPPADPWGAGPGGRHRFRGTGDGIRASKYRTAGIVLIGLGAALLVLISFAGGQPAVGIGVGGAFAILGFAFIVSGRWEGGDRLDDPRHSPGLPPPAPPSSPSS
jgi:hypothetical protein